MSDPAEDIASALVTFIETLDEESTPSVSMVAVVRKTDNPLGDLSGDVGTLTVLLHPLAESEERIGRGQFQEIYTVALLVCRKLTSEYTREALAGYVRDLRNALRDRAMAGYGYVEALTAVKFDPVQRHEMLQFLSVVHLSYTGFV